MFSSEPWLSTRHQTTARPAPPRPLTTGHISMHCLSTDTSYRGADKTFSYLQRNCPVSGGYTASVCILRRYFRAQTNELAFTPCFWGHSFSLDAVVSVRQHIGLQSANTNHVTRKSAHQLNTWCVKILIKILTCQTITSHYRSLSNSYVDSYIIYLFITSFHMELGRLKPIHTAAVWCYKR